MSLNELTSKELSIISEAIAQRIDDLNFQIKAAERFCPEGETLERVTRADLIAVPVLREFHVQIHTAIKEVRAKEIVNEN